MGAGGKCAENVVDGKIKPKGGNADDAVLLGHAKAAVDVLNGIAHGILRDNNALGNAGTAGGEDDICHVFRISQKRHCTIGIFCSQRLHHVRSQNCRSIAALPNGINPLLRIGKIKGHVGVSGTKNA